VPQQFQRDRVTVSRVFSVQAWSYNRDTFKNRKSEVNVVNELCHLILIIFRMALVPSRSDEIEKLKLPGDLDAVTFDLELDPPMSVLMSQGSLMPSFISFHPTVWPPIKDKHTNKHILSF